jgi:hypothetical protein
MARHWSGNKWKAQPDAHGLSKKLVGFLRRERKFLWTRTQDLPSELGELVSSEFLDQINTTNNPTGEPRVTWLGGNDPPIWLVALETTRHAKPVPAAPAADLLMLEDGDPDPGPAASINRKGKRKRNGGGGCAAAAAPKAVTILKMKAKAKAKPPPPPPPPLPPPPPPLVLCLGSSATASTTTRPVAVAQPPPFPPPPALIRRWV